MARLVLENVSKRYPAPRRQAIDAVRNLNLAIENREFVFLVGPSGSGKTTILRLIAGLEEPTAGAVWFDGRRANELPPQNRDVAMVFEGGALFPHLNAEQNIRLGLELRRVPRADAQERLREAAAILDLEGLLSRRPGLLSAGERQRVALARAWVRQPKIFLLDEPLAHLDAPFRAELRRAIRLIHRRLGCTTVCVTHDQEEAMTPGARVAVLRQGALQQIGTPEDLYQRPANRFVAGFIGRPPMNFFAGRVEAGARLFRVEFPGAGISLPLDIDPGRAPALNEYGGRSLLLGLRPEHITVPLSATAPGGHVRIEAKVDFVEWAGINRWLNLSIGSSAFVALARSAERVKIPATVPVAFEMAHAHFFDPDTEERVG